MAIDEFFDGKSSYLRVRVMVDGVMQPRAHIPISENGVPLSPEKLTEARKKAEKLEAKLLKAQKKSAEIRKKKAIPTNQKIPCCSTGVRGITYTCKPDKNHGNLYLYPEFYIFVAEGHKRIAILSRGWERAWEEACKVLVKLKGFGTEELDNFLKRIPDQAEKEKAIKEHLGITSFGNQGKIEDFEK